MATIPAPQSRAAVAHSALVPMDCILLTDSLWISAVYGSPPASGDNMETVIFAVMHDCTSLGVSRAKQRQWLWEKVAENIRSVTSMSLRLRCGYGPFSNGCRICRQSLSLVQRVRDSNHISNLGPRPEEARASSARAVSKEGHRRRSPRPSFETVRMRSVLVARYDRFHGIAVLTRPSTR